MKKWNVEQTQWLKDNSHNLTVLEIAETLNRQVSSVREKLTSLNLKYKRINKPRVSEQEKSFLINNYSDKGLAFCSKELNRKESCLISVTMKLGLKKNIKTNIDSSQINLITKEMAYGLGYLWADGHVGPPTKKSNIVKISIMEEDGLCIKDLFNKIGKWTIYFKKKIQDNWKNQLVLSNYDKYFHQFLTDNDYAIKSKTSPVKILSIIPEHLKHYWWRGYLDGDGCIYHKKSACYVSFTSDKSQNWDFAKSLFQQLSLDFSERLVKRKNGNIIGSTIIISAFRCKILLDYIYQGYKENNIGLPRKHDKYQSILNYIALSKDKRLKKYASYSPLNQPLPV